MNLQQSESRYHAPTSLSEALALLGLPGRSTVVAGATDWLVQQRGSAATVERVIDLKRIPELRRMARADDGELRIGAAMDFMGLSDSPVVQLDFPGVVDAARLIGSIQIRFRATLGGNLCNASPAADTVPILLVNDAQCVLAKSRETRRIPVADFVVGPRQTVLSADEVLVEVCLPKPTARSADAFLRVTPRTEMDIAIASAAARIDLDEHGRCVHARVAIGAVGPRPTRVTDAETLLSGSDLGPTVLAAVARAASAAAQPITDRRGTADYRHEVVGVLARRAVQTALARALQRVTESRP